MSVYGYIRVSTREQNEDRQFIALKNFKVDHIFLDKQSGKDFNRPFYKKMLRKLKNGDIVIVKSIDRLGRDYDEIIKQWRLITKELGADIIVIDMPLLDTTRSKDLLGTLVADLVLQILSFVSQNERESIRQRQEEGIRAAQERGIKFGRPSKKLPENFHELFGRWKAEKLKVDEMALRCGMCVSAFYRKKKEFFEK